MLPVGWHRYTTDAGRDYYHHPATNTTQWNFPTVPKPKSKAFDESDLDSIFQFPAQKSPEKVFDSYQTKPRQRSALDDLDDIFSTDKLMNEDTKSHTMVSLSEPKKAADKVEVGRTSKELPAPTQALISLPKLWGLQGLTESLQAQLFDVTTDEVQARIRMAVVPKWRAAPDERFSEAPDLWGPFWIVTTLVIFFGGSGNIASAISETAEGADWTLVSTAASILYGSLFCLPLLIKATLMILGAGQSQVNYYQVMCVYGYSLTVLLPVSLLCCFPSNPLRWLAILTGCLISIAFTRTHLWPDLKTAVPRAWVASLVFLFQAMVFVMYRLLFISTVVQF